MRPSRALVLIALTALTACSASNPAAPHGFEKSLPPRFDESAADSTASFGNTMGSGH